MAVTELSALQSDPTPNVNRAIGVVRAQPAAPQVDFTLLARATADLGLLPNPGQSPGCSPVIRAFLVQTGLPFAIAREIANNGDDVGHSAGNALDLRAVPGAVNPAAQLAELASVLQSASGMFLRVTYQGTGEFPVESVRAGECSDDLYNSTGHSIHVDSTVAVMQSWLQEPGTQGQQDHVYVKGVIDADAAFGNRSVHYAGRQASIPTKATSDGPSNVNFW